MNSGPVQRRERLVDALSSYAPARPQEAEAFDRIRRLLAVAADPFARDNPEGHVTGSALVARPDGSKFLLVFHPELSRWLQPGGHTEPDDASVFETALREAREETGIRQFETPLSDAILDVDVHAIPARAKDAAHLHFDIRYLLTSLETRHAAQAENPTCPMRWVGWEEARSAGTDASLVRALEKARVVLAREPGLAAGER